MRLLIIAIVAGLFIFGTVSSASACDGKKNSVSKSDKTTKAPVKVAKASKKAPKKVSCDKCSGKNPKAKCICNHGKTCQKCSGKNSKAKCSCKHGKKKG